MLEGDVPVTSFPLATTEFITKNGVKEEHTEWHNIVLWRGLAEAAAKVLRKGKLIYLEGKCHTRSFEDKSGIRRYTTEIVADSFTILGRSSDFDEESLAAENGAGANNKRERIKPYNTNL